MNLNYELQCKVSITSELSRQWKRNMKKPCAKKEMGNEHHNMDTAYIYCRSSVS